MAWFILIGILIVLLVSQADEFKKKDSRSRVAGAPHRGAIKGSFGGVLTELTDSDHIRASRQAWVPPGESMEVSGVRITSGMIYVGRDLPAIDGWSGADAALVNPELPVSRGNQSSGGADLGYWPSYAEISSSDRAAYLAWLASGRRDPKAPLGYVFLFFYGLERRVLFDFIQDARVREELPGIQHELEALMRVYGGDGSFASYGRGLLGIVRTLRGVLIADSADPPRENAHWALPLEVSVPIGELVKRGDPIPARWAHSWAVCSPGIGLRTPAKRCPREFGELFRIRYREKFGDGIKIREPKSRLRLDYRAASRGLSSSLPEIDLDLPDVGALSGPQKKLQALVDQAQDELDKYSRYVGRHDDRASVAAQALLPAELVGLKENEGTIALRELLEAAIPDGEEIGSVSVSDLVELFPTEKPGTLYKNEARTLCHLIRKMGFGIEPDTAKGGQNLGKSEIATIYRLPDRVTEGAPWSDAARLLLQLGSAVAASDDSITQEEERALETQLENALSLDEMQRLRFRAHLRWSLTHPASMRGVRKKTEGMSEREREMIAHAALVIAGADGQIDPGEMKSLVKIYDVLGFPEERLYKEVHEIALTDPDEGPVTVADGQEFREFEIPSRVEEATAADGPKPIRLDLTKVEQISQDSKVASELLASVFQDEDEEPAETTSTTIGGLDGTHSALFQKVVGRSRWGEEEFSALIEAHGLLVSGAIEVLNEAAFEKCGEPLIESGEGWEINEYAVEEMT